MRRQSVVAACAALALLGAGCGKTVKVNLNPRAPAAWPAPVLNRPQVINLQDGKTQLRLDPHRDYLLRLPRNRELQAPGGVSITGGHDVVLSGGSVNVPDKSGALVLQQQTGVMHVQDVRFSGPHLMEGIDLDEPTAVVQLENVDVGTVHGSFTTNHADLIQTWAGPRKLLIDGFTGSTDYQGFFLLPNQHYNGPAPQLFDLRNIYIDARRGGYALWRSTQPGFPLRLTNVYVSPNPAKPNRDLWLWPKPSTGDRSWRDVKVGVPGELIRRVNRAVPPHP